MNTVFYLKVNRDIDYTYACTKYWLDVAQESNAISYIVCDNGIVQEKLTTMFNLCNQNNVVFIKSLTKDVEHVSVEIANKRWKKASDAHLSTFWHAKANNIKTFWNIDADDTSFCIPPKSLSKVLRTVESYANDNRISVFGLDMWWTVHKGNNWTFGITYTDMRSYDWIGIIQNHAKDEAYKRAEKADENVDSYFNYLRNTYKMPIESFYIKNLDFVHWGAPFGPLHYKFRNGVVFFPTYLTYFFTGTMRAGKCSILKEVIPIEFEISEKVKREYTSKKCLKQYSSLYGIHPIIFLLRTKGYYATTNMIREKMGLINKAR